MEAALERGRALLETMAPPAHQGHHFAIDPAKRDCFEMDCYRIAREDDRAVEHAREVLRLHTNSDGSERAPMRTA